MTIELPPALAFEASKSFALFNDIEKCGGDVSNKRRRYAVKICWDVGQALTAREAEEILDVEGDGGREERADNDRRCALHETVLGSRRVDA